MERYLTIQYYTRMKVYNNIALENKSAENTIFTGWKSKTLSSFPRIIVLTIQLPNYLLSHNEIKTVFGS